MKMNLPSSTKQVVAKATKISKTIGIAIVFLMATICAKAQTPVTATLTTPVPFGSCIDTTFTFSYTDISNPHPHRLRITAALFFGTTSCDGSSGAGYPLRFIHESKSSNVTAHAVKPSGDTLTYTVDSTTSTVTVSYRLHIDCTNLPATGQGVFLHQTFTDSTGGYAFDVSNGSNVSEMLMNHISLANDNSTLHFNFHTHDTTYAQYRYTNFSYIAAHLRFKFWVADTTICGTGKTTGYKYSVDNVNYFPFTANTFNSIVIDSGSTLYIRQYIKQTSCLGSNGCENQNAYLAYQCDYIDTTYCSACNQILNTPYDVFSIDAPKIVMTDLTNTLYNEDYSCFNDSLERTFRFVYDTATVGVSDSVLIRIQNYGNPMVVGVGNLSLIDKKSIKLDAHCASCTVNSSFITNYVTALCNTTITEPIREYYGMAKNFHKGDTLILKFKTFRCADEVDSALLNKTKVLNQWVVTHSDYNICSIIKNDLKTYGAAISKEFSINNGQYNLDQQLEFFPTINNLTVPHGQMFGDTLALTVKMKTFTTYAAENFQFLGCNGLAGCHPKGLLRARISVGNGLHIENFNSVYFSLDTATTPFIIRPDYFNDSIPDTMCIAGNYYFYFHFTDTLLYALSHSHFNYTVRACCADSANDEPCKLKLAFHLLPNPDNCFSVSYINDSITPPIISDSAGQHAYIPLSGTTFDTHIHCPGCKAPGLIADRYTINRINYGLQDSNNNGIADSLSVAITDTSLWFQKHKKDLALNHSSFGDKLQDFLIAHFQDGDDQDPMKPGYKYERMKKDSAFMRFIQFSAVIPDYKSHGLKPYDLDFYIDDTISTGGVDTCVDCDLFKVSNAYRTLLHIHIPDSLISNYLKVDTASGTYFTTFSMLKDSAFYVLDTTKLQIKYQASLQPFDSFEVDQRYRLTIKYNECNNFMPAYPDVDNVMLKTEIQLRNWLCGKYQPFNAFDNEPQMPNNLDTLHKQGWQFSDEVPDTNQHISQTFANHFLFYCEANGTFHYFFSQHATLGNYISNITNSCNLVMSCRVNNSTAAGLYNVYPYEYRPFSFFPTSYWFTTPIDYNIDSALINNSLTVSTANIKLNLPTPDALGYYHIPYDSLPKPVCMSEDYIHPSTNQYIKSYSNTNTLNVYLSPKICMDSAYAIVDTLCFATFDTISLDCIKLAECSMSDTLIAQHALSKRLSFANLQVNYPSSSDPLNTHHVCFNVKFANPKQDHGYFITETIYTIGAPHIYMQLLDTNYLKNFTFTYNGTTVAAVNGILNIKNILNGDSIINGTLCADYTNCQHNTYLHLKAGYNCKAYPTPINIDSICYFYYDSINIIDDSANLFAGVPPDTLAYPLCTPFAIEVNFKTQNFGAVYPDSVLIGSIPAGLQLLKVEIKKCNGTAKLPLDTASMFNHYLIAQQQMDSLDFYNGAICIDSNSSCLSAVLTLQASCDFESQNWYNAVTLYSHNFCGDTLVAKQTDLINFQYNEVNNCTNCFTISKTVDKPTAYTGETVTYSIIVCANNGSPQTVSLTDLLPPNFVTISNPLLANPTPTIVAQGCDTFKIKGYFLLIDTCPHTTNTAVLKTSVDTLTATVCNTIVCSTCYSITKTVDKDTAMVGEIITYIITTCGNNSSPQSIIISDNPPSNFTTTFTTMPNYTAIGTGCITDTLKGFFTQAGSCPVTYNIARLDTSAAGAAFKDSVCNTILDCFEPGMIFIADSTHITSSSTSYSNVTLLIQGTLFVDNNLSFTNCHIYVAAGGQILVNTTALLTLDSTIIEGCGYMWNGITLNANTGILVQNSSTVSDATKGVTAKMQSSVDVLNSSFLNCVIGIYAPSNIDCNYNNTHFVVKGSKFGMNGNFKPDFSGQSAHGTRSKAGIEIFDLLNPTIGNNTSIKNQFYKMNTGIIAHRCSFTLTNNSFRNIDTVSFYNFSYNGAAIVSIGENCRAADLTVTPELLHDTTIYTCKRGVYTTYSNTNIDQINIINVERGIYNEQCSGYNMTTNITNCNIKASLRGINWVDNAGALSMYAALNEINIAGSTSGKAISMSETNSAGIANYVVEDNHINLTDANDGIYASTVYNLIARYNFVTQQGTSTGPPANTFGIRITGSDSAQISCNNIYSTYPNTASGSFGIQVSGSKKYTVECDTVDKQYYGIWFGGECTSSDESFKGNKMNRSNTGLYLNGSAKIGIQTLRGNLWTGYIGTYGARNLNTSFLLSSTFHVNNTTIQYPTVSPTSGWFVVQSGSAYSCNDSCTNALFGISSNNDYERAVAKNKSTTVDFVDENKNIAKQNLFEQLANDNQLLNSDTVFANFYSDYETGAIGKLYSAKTFIKQSSILDSNDVVLLEITDSQVEIKTDSIEAIDQAAIIDTSTNYELIRESLINDINNLQQNRSIIIEQQKVTAIAAITNADLINNTVTPQELPETNQQFNIKMLALYKLNGKEALLQYWNEITAIANQCPYAGGTAVYSMRNFIALFNDTIYYDDESVCLQAGFNRQIAASIVTPPEISVVPNPATDKVDIYLNNAATGICEIQIINSLGQVELFEKINCIDKFRSINTSKLSSGVYTIKVKVQGSSFKIVKLIIAR